MTTPLCGSPARNGFKELGLGYVVLLPVTVAMDNPQHLLPPSIQPEKWKMHGWTSEHLQGRRTSRASVQRSCERTNGPNGPAKRLLYSIRETELFWLALRKHVAPEEAQFLLAVFAQRSAWRTTKHGNEQKLRSEYLTLVKECRHHKPDFEHQAMADRLQLAIAPNSDDP